MFVKTTTRSGRVASSFKNIPANTKRKILSESSGNIIDENNENDSSKLNVSDGNRTQEKISILGEIENNQVRSTRSKNNKLTAKENMDTMKSNLSGAGIKKSQRNMLNTGDKVTQDGQVKGGRSMKENRNPRSKTVADSENTKACLSESGPKQQTLIKNRVTPIQEASNTNTKSGLNKRYANEVDNNKSREESLNISVNIVEPENNVTIRRSTRKILEEVNKTDSNKVDLVETVKIEEKVINMDNKEIDNSQLKSNNKPDKENKSQLKTIVSENKLNNNKTRSQNKTFSPQVIIDAQTNLNKSNEIAKNRRRSVRRKEENENPKLKQIISENINTSLDETSAKESAINKKRTRSQNRVLAPEEELIDTNKSNVTVIDNNKSKEEILNNKNQRISKRTDTNSNSVQTNAHKNGITERKKIVKNKKDGKIVNIANKSVKGSNILSRKRNLRKDDDKSKSNLIEENITKNILKKTVKHGSNKEAVVLLTRLSDAQIENKSISALKEPRSKRRQIKTKLDYNEITMSTTRESINTTQVKKNDRVPIYNKKVASPTKTKKDIYEFKEEVVKIAKEEEFEKGMASFIAQLEKRTNTKEKVAKKKLNMNKHAVMQNMKIKNDAASVNNKDDVASKNVNENNNSALQKSEPVPFIQSSTPIKNPLITEQAGKLQNIAGEIQLTARRESTCSNDNYLSSPAHEFTTPFHTPFYISHPSPAHVNKSVQILSDILLDKTVTDDSFNTHFTKPNANSTINLQNSNCTVNRKMPDLPKSPWRVGIPLKKCQFYIKTKKSSLPIYDQDMVIDFKLAEKSFNSSMSKIDSPQPKKTKQDTILNYINSTIVAEPEHEFTYSLFDADQLSPVKNKTPLRETTNCPVPKKPATAKNLSSFNDSFSFFGEENVSPVKGGKPCRLSINEVKKVVFQDKLKKTKKLISSDLNKNATEVVNEPDVEIGSNDEINKAAEDKACEDDGIDDKPVVGLFEDFTEKIEPKASYTRKFRLKRQRYVSCNHDSEDESEVVHIKKKKKDVRTKEEELEVEKLVEKYNEMFKEIDDYKLDVE